MISHRFRCIYVHIPKTAGNSVNRVFGVDWQDHKDLRRYADELTPEIFENYHKFAIVRNPWERLLSDYNFQRKKHRSKNSKLFVFTETGEKRRFGEWVRAVLTDPFHYDPTAWGGSVSAGLHRWSPQVEWITLRGRIAVNTILRMEHLPEDFSRVCAALGMPTIRLPHRNARRHRHYSWYYEDVTRERVASFYAEDIAAFGYRFEPSSVRRAWQFSQVCASSLLLPVPRLPAMAPAPIAPLEVTPVVQEAMP